MGQVVEHLRQRHLLLTLPTARLLGPFPELFKQFMDNASFKRWLNDTVFDLAYEPTATPHTAG